MQSFSIHLVFLAYEIVQEQVENSCYAQIVRTISIALEQIYFFKISFISEQSVQRNIIPSGITRELQSE